MANDPPGSRAERSSARRPWELSAAVTRNRAHGIQGRPSGGTEPTALCSCRAFPQQSLFQHPLCRVDWSEDTTEVSLGARPCCVLTADHSIHPLELSVPLGQGWWATWPVLCDLDSSSPWPGAAGPQVMVGPGNGERAPHPPPWLHSMAEASQRDPPGESAKPVGSGAAWATGRGSQYDKSSGFSPLSSLFLFHLELGCLHGATPARPGEGLAIRRAQS